MACARSAARAGPSGRAPAPRGLRAQRGATPLARRPAPPPRGVGIGLGEGTGEDDHSLTSGGRQSAARPPTPRFDPGFDVPKSHYGLTLRQMEALGVHELGMRSNVDPATLGASAHYSTPLSASNRMSAPMAMAGGTPGRGGGGVVGSRAGRRAPPDLPSLLMDARIVYLGLAITPEVTELIVSELLWLNYANPDKPVSIYIQSTGSQTPNGDAMALEQEAYAIVDTMNYVKPDVYTIAIGQALGSAALILAAGKQGARYVLPHARVLVAPPRLNRAYGRTTQMMIKANELERTTDDYVTLMSRYTGYPKAFMRKIVGRNRWLSAEEAIGARIADKIYNPGADARMAKDRADFERMMKARAAADEAARQAFEEAKRKAQEEADGEGGGGADAGV